MGDGHRAVAHPACQLAAQVNDGTPWVPLDESRKPKVVLPPALSERRS
ncbi:hypothetical protein AB0H28_26605 [Micromonospora sp. NPDC050980]